MTGAKLIESYVDVSLDTNPGLGAVGVVVCTTPRYERSFTLERPLTLNQGEHLAVLLAVRAAAELGLTRLRVYSDSKLVVHQLSGKYRVLSPHLRVCVETFRRAAADLDEVEVVWIPREENLLAHAIANTARKESTDVYYS